MIAESAIAKTIGTLLGTLLALVFIPPKTKKGFYQRAVTALIVGWVSAPFISPWLVSHTSIEPGWDLHVGSGAVGAFCSWWGLGLVKRAFEKFNPTS